MLLVWSLVQPGWLLLWGGTHAHGSGLPQSAQPPGAPQAADAIFVVVPHADAAQHGAGWQGDRHRVHGAGGEGGQPKVCVVARQVDAWQPSRRNRHMAYSTANPCMEGLQAAAATVCNCTCVHMRMQLTI